MHEDEVRTTQAKVDKYESALPAFRNLLAEMRELSKKKADATLSNFKVSHLNRVLADLMDALDAEPESKYLELLQTDALPQNSDAVLVMCQFESAVATFKSRYFRQLTYLGTRQWITEELVRYYNEDEEPDDEDLAPE